MPRLSALTSLRFIAALLVFIHHYMCYTGYVHFGLDSFWDMHESTMAVLLYEMRYGVTLFFVLSGFLLMVRYNDSLFRTTTLAGYWARRVARIIPLYWTLLSIMLVYYIIQGMSTQHFWIFYSLTQGFFVDVKWEGIGTAWSLTVEESFYMCLPIIILAIRYACLLAKFLKPNLRSRWIPVMIGGVILLGCTSFFLSLGESLHRMDLAEYAGFLQDKNDMRTYTLFGRFSDFSLGMFFGLIYLKTRNSVLKKGWLADLMIVLSALLIAYHCIQIYYTGGDSPAWDNLETRRGAELNVYNAIFSAVIIYFLCSTRSYVTRILSWRPFRYLGEISFAMYLIHYNYISYNLFEYAKVSGWGFLTSVTVIYVVLTVVSALCYELIERPAQHLILESTGCLKDSVRRPTALRLLGFARRNKPHDRPDPPAPGGDSGTLAMAC